MFYTPDHDAIKKKWGVKMRKLYDLINNIINTKKRNVIW